jgi:RNA polymerase sigma factor (sigma-70 family)
MENIDSKKSAILNSESDTNTVQLLADFIKGDAAAFTKLYNLHVNMLYNYGCRFTTDKELLKDCVQEVFIKIYNKRTELESVVNFKSYILISLKNKLCDESRKRVNLSDVAVEELDIVSSDNIEKDYIAAEKVNHVNLFVSKMLDKLSPRQRNAIELYYIQEKKYEDICVIMDMNYQSVRNLIHRGIIKLRTCAV